MRKQINNGCYEAFHSNKLKTNRIALISCTLTKLRVGWVLNSLLGDLDKVEFHRKMDCFIFVDVFSHAVDCDHPG